VKILLRLLAGLSLLTVLAAGVMVGQRVLPVAIDRTVEANFPTQLDTAKNIYIHVGKGVALHVMNRDRANRPSGYFAVTTGTPMWPAATFYPANPPGSIPSDPARLDVDCPSVAGQHCHTQLDVYVPGHLDVVVTGDSHPDAVIADADVTLIREFG
jgi:hypothetical protein